MEQLGARQVNFAGLGDKRQITALFCVTLDGHLLPPQLIYKGTTSMCHPNINLRMIGQLPTHLITGLPRKRC